MKLTTLLCFFLLLTSITQAQEKDKYGRPPLVPGIAELKIGDQVPDILINNIVNHDKRSIRTADYKDKLLVLDFWERSCGTCISSMPKLDSLQRVFGDRIKLLSVAWESEDVITKFFKTNRYLNEHTPPVHRASVVGDRALRSYFRYESNPHVVWIYKGKVVAITGYDYINKANIQTLLDGKSVSWPLKNDSFDPMYPFMRLNALSEEVMDSPQYSYSVLTGMSNVMEPEVGGIYFKQDTVRNISRLAFFNKNITTAYQYLFQATKPVFTDEEIIKDPSKIAYLNSHPARVAIEVRDLTNFKNNSVEDQAIWNRKNLICYELEKHGKVDKIFLAKFAIQDLNNRLKLNAHYEKRIVKCLVFIKTDKPLIDTLAAEKGGTLIPKLVLMDLDLQRKFPPAIDETGFGGGLNMKPYDGTIEGLRKEMQRHGLDLIEAMRKIEVMVISDAE